MNQQQTLQPPPAANMELVGHFGRIFDQTPRSLCFEAKTTTELRNWRRRVVRKLKQLSGYDRMKPADSNPRLGARDEYDGVTCEHLTISTEPDVDMSMYVLTPQSAEPPFVPVIAAHGHCAGGKAVVAGRVDVTGQAEKIKEYNYDYGLQLAKAGFLVFCPDSRGFGERQEAASRIDPLSASCRWLNQMGIPLGQTVTGMWAWDISRLIDYIHTRPDCVASKLACVGLSGGGQQTLWASAIDSRIRCAIVSGYFYGYKQSLLEMYENCSCNYVPHLWEHVDMGDIGAAIAPRPLMIESGDEDHLNGAGGLENVRSQIAITQRAYELTDRPEALKHVVFPGGHRWWGREAVDWLRQHTA
jgi:dienelactone hydrolase